MYITCIKDLWAFYFNFGIVSHAQLQIFWSVIVSLSQRNKYDELDALLDWEKFKLLLRPSRWV
jgi:hypothetical protein